MVYLSTFNIKIQPNVQKKSPYTDFCGYGFVSIAFRTIGLSWSPVARWSSFVRAAPVFIVGQKPQRRQVALGILNLEAPVSHEKQGPNFKMGPYWPLFVTPISRVKKKQLAIVRQFIGVRTGRGALCCYVLLYLVLASYEAYIKEKMKPI